MNYLNTPVIGQTALRVLCIMPGATRSQDAVGIFDAQNHAVPIPCYYMDFPSIEALKDSFVNQRFAVRFLEIEPLAEDDPLVRSKLTSYLALGDAAVYKMVQMSENLVYARKLPVKVGAKDLAQCAALCAAHVHEGRLMPGIDRSQGRSSEPDVLPTDAQSKDQGIFFRAMNLLRVRGG